MRQSNNNANGSKAVSREVPVPVNKARKIYRSPVLEQYGDLDTLTLALGGNGADGGTAGMSMACWIAEVLYGVDDNRTHLLRKWLNNVYSRTTAGSFVVALYRAYGKQVAGWAQGSAVLRRILSVPFDAAIIAALRHYTMTARESLRGLAG